MRASLIQLWLRLQASYYFIPSLMVLGAIGLAVITTQVDLVFESEVRELLGWFLGGTADGARAVLGAIAGSMISVAAVTFSLTMVAVTTAAGQYGPRLISNFMRDRANQVTLGTFLATFLYALLVLRNVSARVEGESIGLVPSVSVLVALLLTLMSVGVLIHFIHHIPETLNVGTITGKVAHKLNTQIRSGIFPQGDGLEGRDCGDVDGVFRPDITQTVRAVEPGFVQAISLKPLVQWAEDNHVRIRLQCAPGDYLMTGDPLLDMVSDEHDAPGASPEDADTVRTYFAQGVERTEHQNALFLADELVEIAARALSPGVNDPFTAINCIHWYGEAVLAMMNTEPAPHCVGLPDGGSRVWTQTVDLARLCGVLFGQTRQYVCEDENAARALFRTLYRLRGHAASENRKIIDDHLEDLKVAVSQSGLSAAQKDRLRAGPPFRY